jgi:hypothetical protein
MFSAVFCHKTDRLVCEGRKILEIINLLIKPYKKYLSIIMQSTAFHTQQSFHGYKTGKAPVFPFSIRFPLNPDFAVGLQNLPKGSDETKFV